MREPVRPSQSRIARRERDAALAGGKHLHALMNLAIFPFVQAGILEGFPICGGDHGYPVNRQPGPGKPRH